jgi:hypothetical protein
LTSTKGRLHVLIIDAKDVNGAEQTSRAGLAMSVVRGGPEVAFQGRQDRF